MARLETTSLKKGLTIPAMSESGSQQEGTTEVTLKSAPEGSWYARGVTDAMGELRATVSVLDGKELTVTFQNPYQFPLTITGVAIDDEDGA